MNGNDGDGKQSRVVMMMMNGHVSACSCLCVQFGVGFLHIYIDRFLTVVKVRCHSTQSASVR